jgi:ribose 5-phosphate isomerase A
LISFNLLFITPFMSIEIQKRAAAAQALKLVEPNMRLGLGTGSTARYFVDLLGELVREGLKVQCVPTSIATARQAELLHIPLKTLDELTELDLTIDGTDELDGNLTLIKGGGGALLREKIVAAASRQMVVIADDSKAVKTLGRFPLPVEINPFGMEATRLEIMRICEANHAGGSARLRHSTDGRIFITDGGHYILDCALGEIPDAERLGVALNNIPGVVEHGLFVKLCTQAFIASANGVALHTRNA